RRGLLQLGQWPGAVARRTGGHGRGGGPRIGHPFHSSKAAAANQKTPASSTVAHATVYASRLPCHNPSNHCLSSAASTLAFPPYSSMVRKYCFDSSGLYPRASPVAGAAAR